jgi:chorismate synthase
MNTFGNLFRLTSFGESHGLGVGGVIDGFPAGVKIDFDFLQQELNRRRPGQSLLTTPRKELDKVEILSGVYNGVSTGCPIGFLVRNENQHSSDYDNIAQLFRPSHADYTYYKKYGIRDHRGGGRSSARETITRCVGGAFAKMVLRSKGIVVTAYTSQVGHLSLDRNYLEYDFSEIEKNPVRCFFPSIFRCEDTTSCTEGVFLHIRAQLSSILLHPVS